MSEANIPDMLLCSDQVARRLNVSVRALWRMVQAGTAPQPIRLNRKWVRWRRSDIDAFIRNLK